jgi:plastocyanin
VFLPITLREKGQSMKTYIYMFLLICGLVLAACGSKDDASTGGTDSAVAPATPAASGPATDPAEAATVTGKVSFAGTKPTPRKIRMDADKYCASEHSGGSVEVEEVVANDNGTLSNVLVYVKEGLGDRSFPVPTDAVTLDQKGCVYKPHVISVMANQPIEISNSDNTNHNIHPLPKNNPEWNESQGPKSEKKVKTFAREEVAIGVKCNIHPWMKSYIAVLKHPFHAVTGSDGSFELKGLPPGNYTITAWHEKFGPKDQQVTLAAKDSKAVDFSY